MIKKLGVGVLIPNPNKSSIVMILRKGSHGAGTWGLPGGWVEDNETIQDTAIREAKEEIGVDIVPVKVLACLYDIHPEGFETVTCFVTTEPISDSSKLTLMEPDKAEAIMWMHIKVLEDDLNLFLPFKSLVNTYPRWRWFESDYTFK